MPPRRRLQARRDRHQALCPAAAMSIPLIHLEILAEEIGRCLPAEVALWGDARAGLDDLAEALADDGEQGPGDARRLSRRDSAAHGGVGGRGRAAARFERAADPHGAALQRAEPGVAGRQHPGRRWRLRRALDRTALRHQERPGGISSPTAASPRSATGCRAASARRWRHPATPVVAITRRRRLQHDARRARDRAPRRARADHRRRQQRRLGLRQGVAARDVRRPLPVRRPRRDGLRGDRPGDGLQRHPRRGPRAARRRPCAKASPSATGRPCSTSSSPATRRRCCPPSTTARSRSDRATASRSFYFPSDRRRALVAALATACSEAVTMSLSIPTP